MPWVSVLVPACKNAGTALLVPVLHCDSPTWQPDMATQICRDNGASISQQIIPVLLAKWSATLHTLIHLLLLFLPVVRGCVAKYKIQIPAPKSSSDILGFRMPHLSYDKPPIAGLIAAARFCLGLPTGHISAVYRTKYCYIRINCSRTAQYLLVPLPLALEINLHPSCKVRCGSALSKVHRY